MKNYLHEPAFFTPPSGDTKRQRTLYKGGGGDGGAAKRKAAEDARVADAVQKINEIFGTAQATPEAVDKAAFTKQVPIQQQSGGNGLLSTISSSINRQPTMGMWSGLVKPATQSVFDEAGYNAAVKAAQDKADALNNTASQRENLYTKIGGDATNNALIDLNKDRTTTERDLNFMLARAGLSGGSRDIDVNRDVLDTYQQGVLKASNLGLQTANNARSADDKTRVNLINNIRAGLDEGSANQQAYEGMQNNARAAQDDANATSLAGFFDALKNQQQQAAYTSGVNSVNPSQQYKSTPYSSAINGDRGRTSSY